MDAQGNVSEKLVRHFRQILLWPLQLMPIREGAQIQKHWEHLRRAAGDNPWREVADEFTGDPTQFQERHYSEFVTFLPYVQRFLYGEAMGAQSKSSYGESPIRVFRRSDVAKVRMTSKHDDTPAVFNVAHIDLYFFYDIDIVILAVEIFADNLSLYQAEDTLYRFGRAYPPYWDLQGLGGHCMNLVEWISPTGEVLAVSDYEKREKYLTFVCRHRAPCIAAHWEYLLKPLVLDHSDEKGPIRYQQIEYHRMPILGYLALDDPSQLTRSDYVRLGLVTAPGESDALPYSEWHVKDFEERYCYDRYWDVAPSRDRPSTRFMCCGPAFMMVGSANEGLFTDLEKGLLAQFRHQYFLLCLIPHLHKAALLMLSDRLVVALSRLEIQDPESVKQFKRAIRHTLEIFLRFTHRYWFHEISDQAQAKALFKMCSEHLGTDRLYAEVREEIEDMNQYLESDTLRRQANTVVRLTVVTTFGLIGTVSTGFLGMNLIAAAENPMLTKLVYFMLVFLPTIWLTFYTIVKSKRLSDFLEALSDERLSSRAKLGSLINVWKK